MAEDLSFLAGDGMELPTSRKWNMEEVAGTGATSATSRATIWGLPVIVKYNKDNAYGDRFRPTTIDEYSQLLEKRQNAGGARFGRLPIPRYYGHFSTLPGPSSSSNGADGDAHIIIMSDNGEPVRSDEVKETFS